jgi:hypothetical protein
MAVVENGIVLENDGTISFGDYKRDEKLKVENFEVEGNIYKVRTHKEVTRLSENGKLVLETVPGATVHSLKVGDRVTSFDIEGNGSVQVTLELENDTVYNIYIDDVEIDKLKSNLSGKVSFSAELTSTPQSVVIKKS